MRQNSRARSTSVLNERGIVGWVSVWAAGGISWATSGTAWEAVGIAWANGGIA